MPDAPRGIRDAHAALAAFPGIVTRAQRKRGSHVQVDGDRAVVALVFDADIHGTTARLITAYIFSRMGNRRLDGKAPVRASVAPACASGPKDATYYVCSTGQLAIFVRALQYANATPPGHPRPQAPLAGRPLSTLLGHALVAFERDYDARRGGARGASSPQETAYTPSLGVWSNVLRVIGDDGVHPRILAERSVLSRRGVRAVVRDLERLGWIRTARGGGGPRVLLTAAGSRARDKCPPHLAAAEDGWRTTFGARRVATLRKALVALTRQFEIELPWYLTGYGPGDASATGGDYIAAQTGPPRIPHHGQDWPVVLRTAGEDTSQLPLPALLSQALAMFTIDYEWDIAGYAAGLHFTANLLRHIPDEGLPLAQAAPLGDVSGSGKSGTERHLATVVEPGKPRDGTRRVYLTPKGKAARDSYASRLATVEEDWHSRFGACVTALRTALEALDTDFGDNLPDYPNTTAWYWHSMIAGSAAHRIRRARDAATSASGG